jgi:hypothetical protein
MKTKRRFWFKPILAGLVVSVLALTGCGGSDGDDGATGAPGAPASVDISNAEELSAEILSARIQSPPVVEFQLTDGNGNPVRGLPASAISFNVAKLIPGTDGNSSAWQSYLNTLATATAPGAPGLGSTAIQAVTESGSAGTLTYNESTATYTYTFATDVANVTTPLAVPYQPTLTHRITFEIRGFAPVDNPIYNFRPSDNATTGLFTREIVDTQTCNGCHNDLALHGGARADTDECVACHNPGTTDPDSLNTVDFKVMVHKIHRGEDLTVLPYQIWGFRNTLIDFSDVVFPQDIRNCSNCHNTADPNTPDASNWYTVPTVLPRQRELRDGGRTCRRTGRKRCVCRLPCQPHQPSGAGGAKCAQHPHQGAVGAVPVQHPGHRRRHSRDGTGGGLLDHRSDQPGRG